MERNVNFRIDKTGAIATVLCINRYHGDTLIETLARVTTQKLADELRAGFEEIYRIGVAHGRETIDNSGAQGSEASQA